MITPIQKLILEAWHETQSADFHTLQANSAISDDGPEDDPIDDLKKAISHHTKAARLLDQAKILTQQKNPK